MDHIHDRAKALDYFKKFMKYTGPNAQERSFWDLKILVPTYMDRLVGEAE